MKNRNSILIIGFFGCTISLLFCFYTAFKGPTLPPTEDSLPSLENRTLTSLNTQASHSPEETLTNIQAALSQGDMSSILKYVASTDTRTINTIKWMGPKMKTVVSEALRSATLVDSSDTTRTYKINLHFPEKTVSTKFTLARQENGEWTIVTF